MHYEPNGSEREGQNRIPIRIDISMEHCHYHYHCHGMREATNISGIFNLFHQNTKIQYKYSASIFTLVNRKIIQNFSHFPFSPMYIGIHKLCMRQRYGGSAWHTIQPPIWAEQRTLAHTNVCHPEQLCEW